EVYYGGVPRELFFPWQHVAGTESSGGQGHEHGHADVVPESLEPRAAGDLHGNRGGAVQRHPPRRGHVQGWKRDAAYRYAEGRRGQLHHFVADFRRTQYYGWIQWQHKLRHQFG